MNQTPVPPSHLADRSIAVVIGCGDMGMASARALGMRMPVLIADIDGAKLDDCIARLRHDGYAAQGHQCDITNPEQVNLLGEKLAETPGVQVLSHVAAVGNTPRGWRYVMEVDLIGMHLVARAVEPYFVSGSVAIFISSTGAYFCPKDPRIEELIDDPFQPEFLDKLEAAFGREPHFLDGYYMAKQGMNRLVQRLALEWGPRRIRTASISPGMIDSTMGRTGGSKLPVDSADTQGEWETRAEKAARDVPLGREGTLLEIGAVIDFLASDGAGFITGIDIPVDGGSTASLRARGLIER